MGHLAGLSPQTRYPPAVLAGSNTASPPAKIEDWATASGKFVHPGKAVVRSTLRDACQEQILLDGPTSVGMAKCWRLRPVRPKDIYGQATSQAEWLHENRRPSPAKTRFAAAVQKEYE